MSGEEKTRGDAGKKKGGTLWRDPRRLLRERRRLWREHKRPIVALLVGAVVVLAGGAVLAYELLKRPADVHNTEVPFKPPRKPPKPKAKTVNWPLFGLNRARTRYLPAKGVKPPFRKLWRYTGRPLLEFPPIFVGGKLYFVDNSGFARALDADSGKLLWKRRIGRLNASSPAYSKHRLYVVNLVPGHVIKLDARSGKTIWKKPLPGRAESSPLVIGRSVYFGCECGELFALSTISGNVRWATSLGGPIKSAPAYHRGTLYVGDYGGYMNAVNAKTGEVKWQSGALGPGFGGTGEFYSTPAVAFGRVYAGNNDARVYSFDLEDGELAWTYSTGGYVYSGPTVARTRHTGPTVYIGSFDGNVYALDAKDGSVRWSRDAGGQVIGSLSAVGEIVYAAEFTNETTSGYMMRSGRRVFRYPRGTYTAVVSDGRRLYLTGYSSITALQPFKHKMDVADRIEAPVPPLSAGEKGRSTERKQRRSSAKKPMRAKRKRKGRRPSRAKRRKGNPAKQKRARQGTAKRKRRAQGSR